MKVLFVSSGNTTSGISPITKNQGDSLISRGIEIEFFAINGKGLWSYIRHIFILRNFLKINNFDIIHSHYSFSSFIASLAGARPQVVSLMGSDLLSNRFERMLILIFQKLFWDQTIVKTEDMYQLITSPKTEIIPNGVDLTKFNYIDKKTCQDKLGWNKDKRHLLFAADPERPEKNYPLFKMSIDLLPIDYNIEVHALTNIPNNDIPVHMNASDVIILTSLHEGSPNVIKEAMACNLPIVVTNVGDVQWVIGKTEGCYISSFEPSDFSEKISLALKFSENKKSTLGRDRIIEIGLDAETIALKLVSLYNKLVNHKD